jgi:hypothetical protein
VLSLLLTTGLGTSIINYARTQTWDQQSSINTWFLEDQKFISIKIVQLLPIRVSEHAGPEDLRLLHLTNEELDRDTDCKAGAKLY